MYLSMILINCVICIKIPSLSSRCNALNNNFLSVLKSDLDPLELLSRVQFKVSTCEIEFSFILQYIVQTMDSITYFMGCFVVLLFILCLRLYLSPLADFILIYVPKLLLNLLFYYKQFLLILLYSFLILSIVAWRKMKINK